MNISLTQFCRNHNLSKTSVYRRCQQLGIPTSDGLTPESVCRLLDEFDRAVEPVSPTTTTVVETGNHQIVVANPVLPQSYSLESLRSGEAIELEDPLAIAQQFLAVATSLTTAMQADIEVREQRLQQTQLAKAAIAAKAAELHLESRLYQVQASALDRSVTAETSALQTAMSELQSLGKP